ncbi:MAG: SDR family NAD(P)-dependent oxidoreductase [Chitinophagaceae bacterium]|nr:SDR family NAD(P)-dependent oxidoreductase [Chitinophagaceae bacterium]
MNKTILITGATSGIGEACAIKFAKEGYSIIITGRRKERLAALKSKLETEYNVSVLLLCFDVQNKEEVFTNINALPKEWQKIDILLNNAGLALGRDNFEDADITDWETMINTNVTGLLYVTKAVLPLLINEKKGHIINIGSTAAKEVYENGNTYCASKYAVDALSKAMRIDLLKHNIKVTAVHPGAVETAFSLVRYKGEQTKASATYEGYKPLAAEDVAETIFYCATLPSHVCINDLVITCTEQASSFYFHKNQ